MRIANYIMSSTCNQPSINLAISRRQMLRLAGACTDPAGFISSLPERVILDEEQNVPEIFPSIKLIVDRNRKNGRFIITGSTDILLVPSLSESLAGRMQTICLYPLAQFEFSNRLFDTETDSNKSFLDALFGHRFGVRQGERLGKELAD